jgi:DNA-binding beta-propeller fold protein YncE
MRSGFLATLVALAVIFSGHGSSTQRTAARGGALAIPALDSQRTRAIHHYLYAFPDGSMYVYDLDRHNRLVEQVALPGMTSIRGVVASPATHTLYISHGGDSYNYTGALAAIDMVTNRVLWDHAYPRGVDSMAIDASGTRIYLPDGELSGDGLWMVVDAHTGDVIGRINGGIDPHNTVIGASGRWVYLGGAHTSFLDVASTASDRVLRQVGPLRGGVRPFTINGRETLAFTTATGFLGFQVSSLTTGRVLYTRTFGAHFGYNPATFSPTAPSHGITLTPDERRLYVIDGPNSYVHVFDVSRLPRRGPRMIASIRLRHPLTGTQTGCSFDCARDGWLLSSRSGCSVFVGDSGDVINTRRLKITGYIPALRNTRQYIEVDWRDGLPVATTSRAGLGYVSRGHSRSREACR